VLVALTFGVATATAGGVQGCAQFQEKNEPPCNPYLPDSPWGASHRSSYAQASSPYPGLESAKVETQHIYLPGIPIQLQFTNKYANGGRAVWGSILSSDDNQGVFKIDAGSGKLIDLYIPRDREENPPPSTAGSISGSYNILDRNGNFIVPRGRYIDMFGDSKKGKKSSKITLVKRYTLPDSAFCRDDDKVAGATMTYDGYIALVTEQGVVSTVPRKPAQMTDENLRSLSLNGDAACGDASIPEDELETVSNSIAADEDGGIYIVTSKLMRRVDHDAAKNKLTSAWKAPYNPGTGQSEIRLGAGSGSTPTLMGTGKQDKFVVITDGQDVMHQDLFWRDGIPKDWKGLGKSKPRRMACETPVTFGDPDATASLSEQSVTVRGYATFNVQNLLDYDFSGTPEGAARNVLAALRGGDPEAAPHGAERIDWDPKKQMCKSKWVNKKVSIPNGIPSMSTATNSAYGIAQEDGEWGVAALNWKTGKSRFFAKAQEQACDQAEVDKLNLPAVANALFGPTVEELPNSCNNSTYAATEVGTGGSIWTGTFLGVTIYRPKGG
jgi:hypothetical protein